MGTKNEGIVADLGAQIAALQTKADVSKMYSTSRSRCYFRLGAGESMGIGCR